MKRFCVFKDEIQQAGTATKEQAIDLIRQHQKLEFHPVVRAGFSIIAGEGEFIPCPSKRKSPRKQSGPER